ncbi:MAG: hypothetical protein IPG97_16825 [Microthrixaceae bacterium]|nr:hypothetical protein [Microthrixaceae bacterium]
MTWRGRWVTAVIHTTFTSAQGAGGIPRSWFMSVGGEGGAAEDVVVRKVSAQISPTSVGMDETETEVEEIPVRDMWMEAFARVSDLGVSAWIDGSIDGVMEASWRRPDVQVIEVARMVVESGYGECDFALTGAVRVGRCWVTREFAHDPGGLTLTAEGTNPPVVPGDMDLGPHSPGNGVGGRQRRGLHGALPRCDVVRWAGPPVLLRRPHRHVGG